jgi:hypothetical protein
MWPPTLEFEWTPNCPLGPKSLLAPFCPSLSKISTSIGSIAFSIGVPGTNTSTRSIMNTNHPWEWPPNMLTPSKRSSLALVPCLDLSSALTTSSACTSTSYSVSIRLLSTTVPMNTPGPLPNGSRSGPEPNSTITTMRPSYVLLASESKPPQLNTSLLTQLFLFSEWKLRLQLHHLGLGLRNGSKVPRASSEA